MLLQHLSLIIGYIIIVAIASDSLGFAVYTRHVTVLDAIDHAFIDANANRSNFFRFYSHALLFHNFVVAHVI